MGQAPAAAPPAGGSPPGVRESGVFAGVAEPEAGSTFERLAAVEEQPPAAAAAAAPAAEQPAEQQPAAPAVAPLEVPTGEIPYPGDSAPKPQLAAWMAARAQAAGIPPELPVMAALVESRLSNINYGHADSIGFFQMRTSIWDQGEYAGYGQDPEKQIKWFVDHALHEKEKRVADGYTNFLTDPSKWGEWVADVERPAEEYRGRYQERLEEAQALLKEAGAAPPPPVEPVASASGPAAGPDHAGHDHAGHDHGPSLADAPGPAVTPSAELAALLENPNLELPEAARGDLASGKVDPRLVSMLTALTKEHKVGLSVIITGHDQFSSSGSVSNHFVGRGLDIASVDGEIVRPNSIASRELAEAVADLPESIRPTEVGTPWSINAPGFFTDGAHQDHLHIAYDDPAPESFTPPVAPAGAPAAAPPTPTPGGAAAAPAAAAPEAPSRASGVFAAPTAPAEGGAQTVGAMPAAEPQPQPGAVVDAVVPAPVAIPGAAVAPVAPEDMANTNEGGKLHASEFDVQDAEGAPGAEGNLHAGYDLFAKAGAPVRSPIEGTIVEVKASRGNSGQIFGGTVKVQGADGRVWVFRHVDPTDVVEGGKVTAGQQIAAVTEWAGGAHHAHIELWKTLEGGYRVENMEDPYVELQKAYAGGGTVLPEDVHQHGEGEQGHEGHDHGGGGELAAAGPAVTPSAELAALLENPKLELPGPARSDFASGRVDPRMVSMLTALTKEHSVRLSVVISGHDQFTSGGSVSNHFVGRGIDIAAVDGEIVRPNSIASRELAEAVADLPESIRPTEVGTPWSINAPGFFTDGAHQDHLHIAYDDPAPESFVSPVAPAAAPAEAAAAAAPAAPATPATPAAPAAPEAPQMPAPETPSHESGIFVAAEEAGSNGGNTVQFMQAVKSEVKEQLEAAPEPDLEPAKVEAPAATAAEAVVGGYPGDDAPKEQLAAWMAARARAAGLPPELPVMAALVESRLSNVNYGDADSIGFFQMRTSIWDQGEYAGYGSDPEKQIKWFIDHAVHEKEKRVADGYTNFLTDESKWGEWVADVERPAEQYRGRYQERLEEARALLAKSGS
jgi:murein DD-endopeptidase MepM/ murein hydrolase activator NlpD